MNPMTNLYQTTRRISQLRWFMIASGLCVVFLFSHWHQQVPISLLIQSVLTLALVNLWLDYALRKKTITEYLALHLGLLFDIVILTEIILLSGGASNPLTSLYLPPIIFSALLLSSRYTWCLVLLCICAYVIGFFWHLPWPQAQDNQNYSFNLHLYGMIVTFAGSAILMAGFISYLAKQIQIRDHALQHAQQVQLRNEQIVALGVQAASAAHALSTPLNTLTLLLNESNELFESNQTDQENFMLMKLQLDECRKQLFVLRDSVSKQELVVPLWQTIQEKLANWQNLRLDIQLKIELPSEFINVYIDSIFWPSLFNLLNNAADAGGREVNIIGKFEEGILYLSIINKEGQLSLDQLIQAGFTPLESNKETGLGLGIWLTHATIFHLGGSIRLSNLAEGGVSAQVEMPLRFEKYGT